MLNRTRSVVILGVLMAFAAPLACSSDPQLPTDLRARIESDTGVPWYTHSHPENNEVRFLAPREPVKIGDGSPEEVTRAFFDRYRDALHGTGKPDELRAVPQPIGAPDGMQYVRFDHYVPGTDIMVFEASSGALYTKDGKSSSCSPDFVPI